MTDERIKKLWYIYTMEHYSVTKRIKFESVLVRWTNLELVIQRKVSQKNKYHILMPMESKKNDTDEPLCRAGIEMQT